VSEGSLPPRLLFVDNLRIPLFVTRGLPVDRDQTDSPHFYVAKAQRDREHSLERNPSQRSFAVDFPRMAYGHSHMSCQGGPYRSTSADRCAESFFVNKKLSEPVHATMAALGGRV
jgi:hypothetical protein